MNIQLSKFAVLLTVFFMIASCCKDENEEAEDEQTGAIVFWTPNLPAHGGYVNVTINGLTRTITANWPSPPPNCLSTNGVAYFNLAGGTYSYSTVDFFGFQSTGTVTVVANNCNKQRIE